MPQNFAQVYKKIANGWKKEKSSKKCKLKAETAIGSANDWPKQHKIEISPKPLNFGRKTKGSNAEFNPAAIT